MNRIATAAILLALTAGCTEGGEEGVLSFIGEAGLIDSWDDFAVGTEVTVNVFGGTVDSEGERPDVVVTEATVDDTQLATVLGMADNTIQLDVVGAGTTRLDVSTDVGDDWVEITAVEPVVVLDEDGTGIALAPMTVVVGGKAPVPYSLQSSTGDDLLGGGLSGFDFDGELVGTLLPSAADTVVFVEISAAGEGSVIHPSAQGARSVTAVEQSEVASITLGAERLTGDSSEVDGITTVKEDLIMLLPAGALADGTEVAGVDSLLDIQSAEPSVCTVGIQTFFSTEVLMVSLEGAGTCELTATLGELTDTVTFTVTE